MVIPEETGGTGHKRFAQQSANQSSVVQLVTGMQEIKLSAVSNKNAGSGNVYSKTFPSEYQKSCPRPVSGFGSYIHKSDVECNHYRTGSGIGDRREMTLGMMLSVQYIIGQLNSPIDQLITFIRDMQDARLSVNRLGEIRNKKDEEDNNRGG